MQEKQALNGNRTKRRTRSGQKTAQNAGRTDMDRYIYLSCPSDDASVAIQRLDLVAFEMETIWGESMLDLVPDDWRQKFEAQRDRLNALIESNDDAPSIAAAANSMYRGWLKIDALIRERGIRPSGEAVWIVNRPGRGKCAIFNSGASISYLPSDLPRFHIDEIVKLIPDSLFRVKELWPDAEVTDARMKQELDDEIPF